MMEANRPIIMRWLAAYEGGFVNHPEDPGGATNRGVTQRVYDAFRRALGLPTRSVIKLQDAEHDEIYKRQYWDRVEGDLLPSGVDACVFDMAVHSGVSRAAKTLQRILGVAADGDIGLITLQAVGAWIKRGDVALLIRKYCNERMRFMRGLKHWSTFKTGWSRRVVGQKDGVQTDDIGVIDRATMLARQQRTIHIPDPKKVRVPDAKADGRMLKPTRRFGEAIGSFFETLFPKWVAT